MALRLLDGRFAPSVLLFFYTALFFILKIDVFNTLLLLNINFKNYDYYILKSTHGISFLYHLTQAQEYKNKDYPLKADVETIDGIIKAHYDVISGPAGQPRDWARDAPLQDKMHCGYLRE